MDQSGVAQSASLLSWHDPAVLLVTILLVGILLWALARPTRRFLRDLSRRVWLSAAVVGGLALLLAVAQSVGLSLPLPHVHDEFSYLLAADTFAHGRLTNPTHPMWQHFESFHIIQQPTYQSKYPPGQGLILALGQVIWHPILGVWLSVVLACAATWWMLRAWLPPRWALIGGLLLAIHPLIQLWATNYWGGALPLLGGALVTGAARYLIRRPIQLLDGLALGAGLIILSNTRPYEGLILSTCFGILLVGWIIRRRIPIRLWGMKLALPVAGLMLVNFLWMGYYNYRVTRNPLEMPYMLHEKTYSNVPLFFWQKARPMPELRHWPMREYLRQWEGGFFRARQTWAGLWAQTQDRIGLMKYAVFDLWPLALPYLLLPWVLWRDRWARLAFAILVVFCIGLLAATYFVWHYTAPALPLALYLYVQCLRRLVIVGVALKRWTGLAIPRLIIGRLAVSVLLVMYLGWSVQACFAVDRVLNWSVVRAQVISKLEQQPGKLLVIVRYSPGHSLHDEWVYNGAEIDSAKIVWARDMGPQKNRELLQYFSDRRVRLLNADEWGDDRFLSGDLWDYPQQDMPKTADSEGERKLNERIDAGTK